MNEQKLKQNKHPPYHTLPFYSWQHMLLFLPKIITDLVFGHSIITHIWSPPLHWCGLCTTTVIYAQTIVLGLEYPAVSVSEQYIYVLKNMVMKWQQKQHIVSYTEWPSFLHRSYKLTSYNHLRLTHQCLSVFHI